MSSGKRTLKRGAKKRLFRRFMTIMLSTFVIGTVIVIAGIAGYQKINGDNNIFDNFTNKLTAGEKPEKEKDKLKTNVAVFGVDIDGYRTDTIFVAHYDSERNEAELVSLPRDTMVRFSDSEYEKIRAVNRNTPRTIKLNEMTAYAGIKNINDFTVRYIEKMLGIKIDNYVTVEIDAFRKLVDIIGGVDVDVPRRMRYTDRAQGLDIDLQPGMQHLDGAAAEGLVRFRKDKYGGGYAEGDVGRIKTQHLFLEAFAKKMLSKENIANYPKMIPTMFQHVKTDINILDVPKYYGYATNFDASAIKFHTIPGESLYQNSTWYFVADMDQMDDFVDGIFYKKPEQDSNNDEQEVVEDKSVKIEILNGGAPAGTAGRLKNELEEKGYNVDSIGNYKGEFKEKTIIYAKDSSKAKQFEEFCKQCEIIEDNSLDKGIDVRIVIGSSGI